MDTDSTAENTSVNAFGVKSSRDQFIVKDDVFGLAASSKKFASFLIVAQKFNYNCGYSFHVIYPETIISLTNIINIFPASVSLNSVQMILESVCVRKTDKYIPQSTLWISRLFTELANKNERVCLTLNCSGKI